MDTTQLIRDAKARFKFQENKIYLNEKYSNRLTFASQTGMWTATPELINFLYVAKHRQDSIVLKDNFGNPIRVNPSVLEDEAWKIYNHVMDDWLNEHIELQRNR